MRSIAGFVALLCAAWGIWTVVNGVSLGDRDSDPLVYWAALSVIALATVGLVALSRRWLRR